MLNFKKSYPKILGILTISAISLTSVGVYGLFKSTLAQSRLIPLRLYYNRENLDNATLANEEDQNRLIDAEYRYVREEACVLSHEEDDTVPLKLFWSHERKDNFLASTKRGEIAAREAGYRFQGIQGYAYPVEHSETVPLNNYWSHERRDNVAVVAEDTKRGASESSGQYKDHGTRAYVYPASKC